MTLQKKKKKSLKQEITFCPEMEHSYPNLDQISNEPRIMESGHFSLKSETIISSN